MRKHFLMGGVGVAAIVLSGWFYYVHVPAPAPAPQDLTTVLPRKLVERANPAELAVLQGEATFAPISFALAATAGGGGGMLAGGAARQSYDDVSVRPLDPGPDTVTPAGLTATLTSEQLEPLRGQVRNATAAPLTCAYPAGTLFTNGQADMVLLRNFSVQVPAHATAEVVLAVAATDTAYGAPEGRFVPHPGGVPALRPLLDRLALKEPLSPGAVQTAVLALTEDVPLDVVSGFPRLRPLALAVEEPNPFRVSALDIIDALVFLREAGVDTGKLAMCGEPQLKAMSILDPKSHDAAMNFFNVTDEAAWSFWQHQLLEGDPSLRQFALYGIARYYPAVALDMLPRWVRDARSYREYRISAAWALALVDDPRAQKMLEDLQGEFKDDAALRQSITRALQHRADPSRKVAGPNVN